MFLKSEVIQDKTFYYLFILIIRVILTGIFLMQKQRIYLAFGFATFWTLGIVL